ncbi:MAG: glycosyltransferase family 9 protein [bacterium]|nr:glycosyltransferase family 9 protein [bacterium]
MFKIFLPKKKRVGDPSLLSRLKLALVQVVIFLLNFFLQGLAFLVFRKCTRAPKNIIVYKTGNIGDIACAIPALIAIRRAYPNARLCLLTSPGEKGRPGAAELLKNVWYVDELLVYHKEDVASLKQKIALIRSLRTRKPDLFIHLPEDLAKFRTLLRNLVLARAIGARSAYGFVIRSIQLFKKTQVDYVRERTEVESLLDLLRDCGIKIQGVEFGFDITPAEGERVQSILNQKKKTGSKIIVMCPGGKRPANLWPKERFTELAKRLVDRYDATIAIVGNKAELSMAKEIARRIGEDNAIILTGELTLRETIALIEKASLVVSNSTGTIHLAAAVGTPTVVIDTIRNVPGRWFPYGETHEIVYHRFLHCNYREESCIEKSIEAVTVDEVFEACGKVLTTKTGQK